MGMEWKGEKHFFSWLDVGSVTARWGEGAHFSRELSMCNHDPPLRNSTYL